MDNFYILVVLLICVIVLKSFLKQNNTNQALIIHDNAAPKETEANRPNEVQFEADQELILSYKVTQKEEEENFIIKKLAIEPIKSELSNKNSWLYPTDEFGKMEIGTEYDSQIYDYGIDYSSKSSDFEIISVNHQQKRD